MRFITIFHPWKTLVTLAFLAFLWPMLALFLGRVGIAHNVLTALISVVIFRVYLYSEGC